MTPIFGVFNIFMHMMGIHVMFASWWVARQNCFMQSSGNGLETLETKSF